MKKNRYDVDSLMTALKIIDDFEAIKRIGCVPNRDDLPYSYFPTQNVFSSLLVFMDKLKMLAENGVDRNESQKIIDTFKVLTEISFDKLEKDVMGVN